LRVAVDRDRISEIEWVAGSKNESELRWQLWLGYALSAVATASLIRFILLLTMRVTLTRDGLKLPRRELIGFDSMTELVSDDFQATGKVVLKYGQADDPRCAILDGYLIAQWKPIVSAICERKGFHNPFDVAT
jgi:hypothetical protein